MEGITTDRSITVETTADITTDNINAVVSTIQPKLSDEIPALASSIVTSFVGIICLIGLVTNVICLIVLAKQKHKTSTEIFFIGLTISDLAFMTANVILQVLDTGIGYFGNETLIQISIYIRLGCLILYLASKSSSGILIAIMTIERNFAVYKPLKFRIIWTPFVGRVITIAVICLSIIIMTLLTLFANLNVTEAIHLAVAVLTGVTVAISNAATLYGLTKSRKFAQSAHIQNTAKIAKERRQTQILVGISAAFLICMISQIVDQTIMFITTPDFVSFEQLSMDLQNFITISINSIVQSLFSCLNCVVFVALHQSYRQQFFAVLCCRKCR